MSSNKSAAIAEDEAFSFTAQWTKLIKESTSYLLSKWHLLLLSGILGSALFACYVLLRPVTYTSRISFVVEESKLGGGGSIMSALAGQFGFDINSATGGSNGVLSGDNVLELLKSHSLIRKTLLTRIDSSGKTLADEYAEVTNMKAAWLKKARIGRMISFQSVQGKLGRTEDSLLQKIIKNIIDQDLSIKKPDKKLGFFELMVTMQNETLALLFSQRLLKTTTDFYIDTKTRRLSNNVNRLQAKADSLATNLNQKTYSAANANRLLLDANPVYAAPGVSAEISSRDKITQATIYAEIIKNLEVSKTALIQETPTFQIVDDPEIPLKDNKLSLVLVILAGFIVGAVLMAVGLLAVKK